MKKFIMALLTVTLIVSSFGCEKKQTDNSSNNSEITESSETPTIQPDPYSVKTSSVSSSTATKKSTEKSTEII